MYCQIGFHQNVGASVAAGRYQFKTAVVGPRKSIRLIRNAACEEAATKEYTHLFFMDDDIAPKPNVLDCLLAVNKPIVGSFVRNADGYPCVWRAGERYEPSSFRMAAFQCDAVGSGCMLIQTAALQQMKEPWFRFDESSRTMDVNFCNAARAADFEVWCSLNGEVKQIVPMEVEV